MSDIDWRKIKKFEKRPTLLVSGKYWEDPEYWKAEFSREDPRIHGTGYHSIGLSSDEELETMKESGPESEIFTPTSIIRSEKIRRGRIGGQSLGIEVEEEGPPKYVYHLTKNSSLSKILKEGLIPKKGGGIRGANPIKGIYTSRYPEDALVMISRQYHDRLAGNIKEARVMNPTMKSLKKIRIQVPTRFWTLLKVKLDKGMRFTFDPDFSGLKTAGYTNEFPYYVLLDPVSPRNLEVVKKIDLSKA